MVGGQNSFVAGGYAGTPLATVLPVELDGSRGRDERGHVAVRAATGRPRGARRRCSRRCATSSATSCPQMPGANVLGDVRPGGVALWTHPTRTTKSGAKMPVLAVGEEGDGRTIALGVDGAWELEFSELGARTAGRGHGALWDGLLGWLMRDPRFEPAQLEVVGGCTAGLPSTLRARLLPGPRRAATAQTVALDVTRIDKPAGAGPRRAPRAPARRDVGRARRSRRSRRAGTRRGCASAGGATTRHDFACEAGGDEWADSRPDPARLEALARATGGAFVDAADAASLAAAEAHGRERRAPRDARSRRPGRGRWPRRSLLGVHWIARRRSGLALIRERCPERT